MPMQTYRVRFSGYQPQPRDGGRAPRGRFQRATTDATSPAVLSTSSVGLSRPIRAGVAAARHAAHPPADYAAVASVGAPAAAAAACTRRAYSAHRHHRLCQGAERGKDRDRRRGRGDAELWVWRRRRWLRLELPRRDAPGGAAPSCPQGRQASAPLVAGATARSNSDDDQADWRLRRKIGQVIAPDALAGSSWTIKAMPGSAALMIGVRPPTRLAVPRSGLWSRRSGSCIRNWIQTRRSLQGALLMAADEDDDAPLNLSRLRPLLCPGAAHHGLHRRPDPGAPRRPGGGTDARAWAIMAARNPAGFPPTRDPIDCSDVAATQGDSGDTDFSHQHDRLAPVIAYVAQVIAGSRRTIFRVVSGSRRFGRAAVLHPAVLIWGPGRPRAADLHPATVAALAARAKAGPRGAKRAGKRVGGERRSAGKKTAKRNAATKAKAARTTASAGGGGPALNAPRPNSPLRGRRRRAARSTARLGAGLLP